MDKILQLRDVKAKGVKGDPNALIAKLNRAMSQMEYGKAFCQEHYHHSYIDGLIDTVKHDYDYSERIIKNGKRALASKSLSVKNRFLKSVDNFDHDFIPFKRNEDADYHIKAQLRDENLVIKQLEPYASDTVVELSGSFQDCIHPLKYSAIKSLMDSGYLD